MAEINEFSLGIFTDIVDQLPNLTDLELQLLGEAVKFLQQKRSASKPVLEILEKALCAQSK